MSSPFRRLLHWGPISVLCITKVITWSMVHLMGMWWPPHASVGGALHSALFLGVVAATLYYFLQSLLEGPGFVPVGWRPDHATTCGLIMKLWILFLTGAIVAKARAKDNDEDTEHLQFCTVCNGYKAPRSHHCRKCGCCVLKMDHHCPWINCCVGHNNHGYFTMFLTATLVGCLQASVVLPICVYHSINRVWYLHYGSGQEPMIKLTLTTLLLTLLAIGFSVGIVFSVSALLYLQIRGILRNQTTIEEWVMEKAVIRHEEQNLAPFVFPYDLGWKKNFKFVFFGSHYDGISWPVRDGCGVYDLTREQQAQKSDKRLRSRLYTATHKYSGRWVPLFTLPRAACAVPCTDEPRLPLQPGDVIRATRQRKHWLFGEKQPPTPATRGPRGWFPRACAVPTDTVHKLKPD